MSSKNFVQFKCDFDCGKTASVEVDLSGKDPWPHHPFGWLEIKGPPHSQSRHLCDDCKDRITSEVVDRNSDNCATCNDTGYDFSSGRAAKCRCQMRDKN